MVAESRGIRFSVDNGSVSSLQSELDLAGHIREHVPRVNANSRDTIPIMPATKQVLCPQNTRGYIKMGEVDLPLWRDFSDILLKE